MKIMGIKGYCTLKNLGSVFIGYPENGEEYEDIRKTILEASYLPIMDIAVDGDGLMVIEPKGRCVIDVRNMESIRSWFECEEYGGIIMPRNLNMVEKLVFWSKRTGRKGGYGAIVKQMVIMSSLHKGKFTDDFLFQNQ